MQLEDSYINISLMSVLLFNLQREVQRLEQRARGRGVSRYPFQMLARLCGAGLVALGLEPRVSSRCDASC